MRQPAKIGQLLGITWLALAPVIVCFPSLSQDEIPQVPSQPAGAGGFPLSESFHSQFTVGFSNLAVNPTFFTWLDYGIPLIDVPNPDLEEQRWSFSLWLGTGF